MPVRVNVPVLQALPAVLLAPVTRPVLARTAATNEDLVQLLDARAAAIDQANAQLAQIRALQPGAARD